MIGPHMGFCAHCGAPTGLRAVLQPVTVRAWLRTVFVGNPPAWVCSPCLSLLLDGAARVGRHRR